MAHNLKLARIFWTVTTALTFLAALAGVLFKEIYVNLFPTDFLPGAFPQDVLTIFVCIFLFVLIAITREKDVRKQVIILGLLGSFFYLYGIFTMERVYNWFYLLYMAVFAASFWSVVYSLSGFRAAAFVNLRLSNGVRKTTAIVSIFIAVIFIFLWTMALLPLMSSHNRIEFMYSIFILDLCFVMPAFIITAVMSLRKMPLGILMGPAIMILGFFVIFPLGLNELAKPSAGLAMNFGSMAISFVFAFFMLALAGLQLKSLHFE
jgi:hypothetical protein